MDRQHGGGGAKTANDLAKEQAGRPIGERHSETGRKSGKTTERGRGGPGDPLDAVRDVVNEEKD